MATTIKERTLENAPSFDDAFAKIPNQVRSEVWRTFVPPSPIWHLFLKSSFPRPHSFWIAYRTSDGEPVGRLGANVCLSNPKQGYIGFFEFLESSLDQTYDGICESGRLLAIGLDWLRSQGVETVIGPVNFSTWYPYRLSMEDQAERFAWEPNTPPAYKKMFEAAGFKEFAVYGSAAMAGIAGVLDALEPYSTRTTAEGFRLEPFDKENFLKTDVPVLHDLTLKSYANNFLFEPIGLAEFVALYAPFVKAIDYEMSCIVRSESGVPAAFLVSFVDQNYAVLKTAGVIPAFLGRGLAQAAVYRAFAIAHGRRVDRFIAAMFQEGAKSDQKMVQFYSQHAKPLWRHKYILYSQTIK